LSVHDDIPATPHGRVAARISSNGRAGALVAVRCRSRALARSGQFEHYADRLCRHVLERNPRGLEALARQDWSYDGGTVEQAQLRFAESVGEPVRVARLARFINPEGIVWAWIHPDARRGVLLSLSLPGGEHAIGAVAFQLAGQILVEHAGLLVMESDGPREIFDPDELCARPWLRDPARTVGEVLAERLGEGTRVAAYARFELG